MVIDPPESYHLLYLLGNALNHEKASNLTQDETQRFSRFESVLYCGCMLPYPDGFIPYAHFRYALLEMIRQC